MAAAYPFLNYNFRPSFFSMAQADPVGDDTKVTVMIPGDVPYAPVNSFEELKKLNISTEVLKGIPYRDPGNVQAMILGLILPPPHRSLMCQASSGWGKSTCFALAMLSRIDPTITAPQALCICSSNDLALHNMEVLSRMGEFTGITSELAILADPSDDVPITPVTAQAIIGTPGTIIKWMSRKKLDMSQMKILVFDEADHMLKTISCSDDCVWITKAIARANLNCQVLLFSATFGDVVRDFRARIVEKIFVGEHNQMFVRHLPAESVAHFKIFCPTDLSKIDAIKKILKYGESANRTIIFVRGSFSANKLLQLLDSDSAVIYGGGGTEGMATHSEDVVISVGGEQARSVLTRGLGVQNNFDKVINYDLPVDSDLPVEDVYVDPDYEVYTQQMCKIGRLGRIGIVFNLLCDDKDVEIMAKIEKYFKFKLKVTEVGPWNSDVQSDLQLRDALQNANLG